MKFHPKNACAAWCIIFAAFVSSTAAEVERVEVEVPQNNVWVGEKATFFVHLRGRGPFVGAAGFSVPQVPRTVILKVGNPVVSSENIEDESWFVQTHEFALFSQSDGTVDVPSFAVRFADRDGFTGPQRDHVERVPAIRFQVERPPDSDRSRFLVTTNSLDVTENWEPRPGESHQGDLVRRTITQRANQVNGMALAPPPDVAPKGVRVYVDPPKITDNTERGEYRGSRSDTMTYVFEQPGRIDFPAIEYVWWNPDDKQFGSTTLPGVTFEVQPVVSQATSTRAPSNERIWMIILVAGLAGCGLCYWQRRRLRQWLAAARARLNPPDRAAARKLLRACRRNDAEAAEVAWNAWRQVKPSDVVVSPRLRAATKELQRRLFGPSSDSSTWRGAELAAAFRELGFVQHSVRSVRSDLPQLNPSR